MGYDQSSTRPSSVGKHSHKYKGPAGGHKQTRTGAARAWGYKATVLLEGTGLETALRISSGERLVEVVNKECRVLVGLVPSERRRVAAVPGYFHSVMGSKLPKEKL